MREGDVRTVRDTDLPYYQGTFYRASVRSVLGDRETQQDAYVLSEQDDWVLGVVCDGMGGMNSGERASTKAVESLQTQFLDAVEAGLENVPQFFARAAARADRAVWGLKDENGRKCEAGTTIVAVAVKDGMMSWLSVGDSKLFIYRNGQMLCPVKMHNCRTMLEEKLARGAITREAYEEEIGRGEALTSFLGLGNIQMIETNRSPFRLLSGDMVLLCSDGLYRKVPEDEIREILLERRPVEEKTGFLVDAALAADGPHDNTTVLLFEFY